MVDINKIGGLLSTGNPMLDIGMGLLAQSGPVVGAPAPSLGQAVAGAANYANERAVGRLQTQAYRNNLQQMSRQRQAMSELQSLFQPGQSLGPVIAPTAPAISTPEGQTRALGLMAEAAPDQFMSQMFNQYFPQGQQSQTSLVQNLRAAGIDPASDEGRDLIRQSIIGSGGSSEELDNTLKLLQLESLQRQLNAETRTEQQDRQAAESAVFGTIRDVTELIDLNNSLQGTSLETGVGMEGLRRSAVAGVDFIKQQLGLGDAEAARLVADFDRFEQLATGAAVHNLEILRGTGTISNQKFQTLLNLSPGTARSAGANRAGFADMLEAALEAGDSLNLEINNRSELERLISELRDGNDGGENDLSPSEMAELERLRRLQGGAR